MKILRLTYSLILLFTVATTTAKPSVLTVANHINDSTIVYPESVETDVHKLMQNWYLRNYTALDKDVELSPDVATSDEELIKRLQSIPTTIEMPFNSVVRNYIDLYTGKKRSLVESMLGMSLYYMPIFEEALEREGLPIELKYLPVIESALNPDAVSRAGATGLWQIMLPTARGLGLEVNTLVDERRDPVASSAAATSYLRQLYEIYKDWSLAIAAYNCGPGNVNKALRRAGADTDSTRRDFWAIYPFLPAETRGYVPCFIAATYVMNFYNKHNISPALARRPIITDSVHVHHRVNFKQIADVLQLPVDALQTLNPQYRKQEIPGDIRPYSLVLPANQVYAYILSENQIVSRDADRYARRATVEPSTGLEPRTAVVDGVTGEYVTVEVVKNHKVKRNETLSSIANKYGMTLAAIKKANPKVKKLRRGQTIKVITTQQEFRPIEQPVVPAEGDELLVPNAVGETVELAETVSDSALTEMVETANEPTAELNVSTESQPVLEAEADGTDSRIEPSGIDDEESSEAVDAATATSADVTANSESNTLQATSGGRKSEVAAKVAGTFGASKAKQQAQAKQQPAETKKSTKKSEGKKADTAKGTTKSKTYTVRKGDSLYKIAKRNGTTVQTLQRINGIDGSKLKPGDKIKLN